MTAASSRAAAYVRVRAWKSRLLDRQGSVPLVLAADDAAMERALAAMEAGSPLQRLVRILQMAIRGYRSAAPLFLAMLRLHEIENIKLLWRVTLRHRDPQSVRRLWIPFDPLATVSAEALDTTGLRDLTERLARTPYRTIASDVARAYDDDLGAAELAFDRWASACVLEEARKLPRRESLARRLIENVVRERDSEILLRGERWFGLSEPAARTAAAMNTPAEDIASLRRDRLRLCRRAFLGDPFTLAPPVALVVLAQEEVRGVRALVERQGDADLDQAAARALAGAQFGS